LLEAVDDRAAVDGLDAFAFVRFCGRRLWVVATVSPTVVVTPVGAASCVLAFR
jgi:hypothetical protein